MIRVKLLAFAQAADRLGWRERLVECAPDETLRAIVERNAPGFDFTSARAAVNCEYAAWDDAAGALAREIAILPPVSGG
jgi:molybdopterin converting factor small subunit